MIYATFVVWLILILGMGIGVFRLWSQLLRRPVWVNWAILPGTVVSEIAYIFGCLITGGEVERARLMDGGSGSKSKRKSKYDDDKSRFRVAGSVISSLVSIVACAGAIVAAQWLLGRHVMARFTQSWSRTGELPEKLPLTWVAFWGQLDHLVLLQRRACEALIQLEWTRWQVALFVYLTLCLAIRLTPVRGTARQTLGALLILGGIVALIAAFAPGSKDALVGVWPLLTYVWTALLTLLLITLVLCGVVAVIRVLAGTTPR